MQEPGNEEYPPLELDLSRPSVSRVYDYYLGGDTNWIVDREFAESVLREFPSLRNIARANRLFLYRVVRHLMRLGVRQFVDIGSGVPTMGHVHQVAEQIDSNAKVVYVDNEPLAVAHSRLLLERNGDPSRHAAITADLRDPERLWEDVLETGVITEQEPVACLLIAVLHVQQKNKHGEEVGPQSVERIRDLLPPHSYLALSHVTDDGVPDMIRDNLKELEWQYEQSGSPIHLRSKDEIESFLGEYSPIPPGMCWTPAWHPEEANMALQKESFETYSESAIWSGVGHRQY